MEQGHKVMSPSVLGRPVTILETRPDGLLLARWLDWPATCLLLVNPLLVEWSS